MCIRDSHSIANSVHNTPIAARTKLGVFVALLVHELTAAFMAKINDRETRKNQTAQPLTVLII